MHAAMQIIPFRHNQRSRYVFVWYSVILRNKLSTYWVKGHVVELGLYKPPCEKVVVVGGEHVDDFRIETEVITNARKLLTDSE